MKEELTGNMKNKFKHSYQKGMSTLEILIAFAILILVITAAIGMGFGNQSITVDSETNTEALYKVQSQLENARAQSRKDFFGLTTTSGIEFSGLLKYTKNLLILDISSCSKTATSTISWGVSPLRTQTITLSSMFNDIQTTLALGGDCVDAPAPEDEWDNPDSFSSIDINPSGNKASDLDADTIDGNDYVFLTSLSGNDFDDDFWVINVNDPQDPVIVTSIKVGGCLNASGFGKACGLNAIDVAGNYAYVANASSTSNSSSDEVIVVNISNPASPFVVTKRSLGISPTCTGGSPFCPGGAQAIKFFSNKLLVGTHRINGNEITLYNVTDPTNPIIINGANINHNIYDITAKGNYAYIASSDDSGEVLIEDMNNLIANPTQYNLDGDEDASAIYNIGNKLFIGRRRDNTSSSGKDIYILDIANSIVPQIISTFNPNLNKNTGITGIIAINKFVFISTSDSNQGFMVLNISNLASPVPASTCSIYNYSEKATGIDFLNDYAFVSNESQKALRIIYDQPSLCSL